MTDKIFTHTCKVCEKDYKDSIEEQFWCSDCDNEYAEWVEQKGYVVGEFDDRSHPNYVIEPRKGTKWEKMES